MIYVKMVLRNVKRSSKDYLIYFLTLVLCVALFYSFLSISSSYYHPNIGANYDISMLGNQMKAVIVLITSLLIFLVHYVNSFMVRRKQKEFALQTIMGMERRTTAFIFFSETFVIGIAAFLFGLFLGSIFAQGITVLLLSAYGKPYTFVFLLFPDTAFISLIFFLVLYLVAGLLNIHTIQKIKVIDMLKANEKTEHNTKCDICMLFICLVATVQLLQAIDIYNLLNDNRFMLIIKILQFSNLAFSFLLLLVAGVGKILKKTKKRQSFFLLAITVLSILMIVSSLGMIAVKQAYFLPIESNQINILLLCAGGSFLFCICMFFFFAHKVVEHIKAASMKIRYHKENLFLFGQLTSKLKTNARTMTIISISLCYDFLHFVTHYI